MAALAGYAYFSRAENYNYIPDGNAFGTPWDAPLRAYAVYDNGTTAFLGSGTYASSQSDSTGQRFGYNPLPEYLAGDPVYQAYYSIAPGGLAFIDLLPSTERTFFVQIVSGSSLLSGSEYYDISALAPGAVDAGENYIAVNVWEADMPDPIVVDAVVKITPIFWDGITTLIDSDRVLRVASAPGAPPETPAFWTSLVGTKEKP